MTDEREEKPESSDEEDLVESAWDRGLAAVYGEDDDDPDPSGGDDADSILATLEARLGTSSRVLLPDDDGDAGSPSVFTREGIQEGRRIGKYLILGEIARGGMGVILRGRDIDLGRDVALKVLKGEHANKGSMVQRFVEEAQIGGQLQHPGVVPVYEMGLDASLRPFFAMKLVNGRTFSAILREREDASSERVRHLQVFEAVCQTIAYAHSRNVIHRDVKPANVMVGAFGEVQVFDWGFAKVLTRGGIDDERAALERDRQEASAAGSPDVATVRSDEPGSQSIAGSVLGTPSYMPPEQACGNVAALDERADVFALGAILCEILTGRPPYVRQPGSEIIEQAQDASLDEAYERLRTCGADGELVDLAMRCLQDERDSRPRDAGVVAKAISDHLARSEERTQAAQVSAAEARVRAEAERKARRLTAALAASVLLLVCIGVGIVWTRENDRIAADREIHAALADARDLVATSAWPAAQEALRRAEILVDAERGSPEAHREVRQFKGRFEQDYELARLKQADEDLVERLREIHTQPVTGSTDFASHAYAEALRDYGIDVLALETDEAARLIRSKGRRIAVEIAFALDDWTGRRQTTRSRWDQSTRKTLLSLRSLAAMIDDDPWRQRLRDAARTRNRAALTEIAEALTPDDRDPRSIGLLAMSLIRARRYDTALTVLRKAFHAHPGDFWINYSLSMALAGSHRTAWDRRGRAIDPERLSEALLHTWIALSHQPKSASLRYHLANLLQLQGQSDDALIHMNEAVELEPESTTIRLGLANLMIAQGELDWAREQLAKAFDIPIDSYIVRRHIQSRLDKLDIRAGVPLPTIIENLRSDLDGDQDQVELHRQLAVALYRTADWAAAQAAAEATLSRDPGDLDMRLLLAQLKIRRGQFQDAIDLIAESKNRGDEEPDLERLETTAKTYREIAAELDVRVHADPPPTGHEAARLAAVLLRRGRLARAAQMFIGAWGERPPGETRGRVGRGGRGSDPRSLSTPMLRGEPSDLRDAVTALARAGCGRGAAELHENDRRKLRATALRWFERTLRDLERHVDRAERSRWRGGPAIFPLIEGWLYDVRLDCVRDAERLKSLPDAEARAWTNAWARLSALLPRARR